MRFLKEEFDNIIIKPIGKPCKEIDRDNQQYSLEYYANIEANNKIIGYVDYKVWITNKVNTEYIWVNHIFIEPEYRNMRYGTKALKALSKMYNGPVNLTADNEDAERLYKRIGKHLQGDWRAAEFGVYEITEDYLDKEEKFFDYRTQIIDGKDIFDKSTTGISYYDNFLNSRDLEYMKKSKGLNGEIVYMTPLEYFKYTGKMFGKTGEQDFKDTIRNIDIIKHLKDVILKYKRRFPLVYLNFSNNAQEGRHRMAVAAELFGKEEKFPVLVVTNLGD